MLQKYLSALLVILLHLGGQAAYSQNYEIDTTRIREVINKWNEAHNQMDADAFNELYAPTVLFYANYLPKKTCLEKKLSVLHKQPFEQHIASDLQLTFYEEGIIYCGFTKEVSTGRGKKRYPSYLLLKRFGERYLITGESDLITDRNLKFQLHLGPQIHISELSSTTVASKPKQFDSSIYGMMLLVVLVLMGGTVIYLIRRRPGRHEAWEEPPQQKVIVPTPKQKVVASPQTKTFDVERFLVSIESLRTAHAKQRGNRVDQLAKGHTFEEYVVRRFRESSDHFKWLDATSDKGTGEHYPESNLNPDLTYEYRGGGVRYPFFVECKFRSATSGQIELTKDGQLERYKRSGMAKGMEVFIVLGLGGTPARPKELFVIPISEAKQVMDKETLNAYKARPSFYYDVKEGRLY